MHHRFTQRITPLWIISSLLLLCFLPNLEAQQPFEITWEKVAEMPSPLANNAVVGALVNDTFHIYSFTGIDPTLDDEGISLEAWRYTPSSDSWLELPPVPDTLGKIAAGASFVNRRIYVMGGYHVFPDGHELSSERVHIFNPETNSWEADGAPIPISTDDHIQAVWRDSLIYLVTGWHNTGNIPDVQIYDPFNDVWTAGTPVPSVGAPAYRVFGGSGVILGDEILYAGGARVSGFSFVLGDGFRKGQINPEDPTDISWSTFSDIDALNYRAAAAVLPQAEGEMPVWIGGSNIAYNFDAIAYNGSGPVEPNEVVTMYSPSGDSLFDKTEAAPPIMDLRGIAVLGPEAWTMGGIDPAQEVLGSVYYYRVEEVSTGIESPSPEVLNWISLAPGVYQFPGQWSSGQGLLQVFDMTGRLVLEQSALEPVLDLSQNPAGIYVLVLHEAGELRSALIPR